MGASGAAWPGEIDAAKAHFRASPEVQQCYYVTGEADFVLVLAVESMAAYEEFTRRNFFQSGNVKKFRTFVSMDAVKRGSALQIKPQSVKIPCLSKCL